MIHSKTVAREQVQFNKVYQTPCTAAPSSSFGSASDERCSLGPKQVLSGTEAPSTAWKAAAAYFSIVFGTGFLLGALRVTFVVPAIGERYAELAETPFMLVAIILAARFVLRRFRELRSPARWAVVGALAFALLVAAEFLLAVVLSGRSAASYFASKDPVSGSVFLVMLLVFAAMPWLLRKAMKG